MQTLTLKDAEEPLPQTIGAGVSCPGGGAGGISVWQSGKNSSVEASFHRPPPTPFRTSISTAFSPIPCDSDTFGVSETDSTQIEKASLFYVSFHHARGPAPPKLLLPGGYIEHEVCCKQNRFRGRRTRSTSQTGDLPCGRCN